MQQAILGCRGRTVAKGKDVEVTAIDVGNLPGGLLPRFGTDYLMEDSRFDRRTDTSLKRNVGLLIAQLMGWQRVVFLDDDIEVPSHGPSADRGRADRPPTTSSG